MMKPNDIILRSTTSLISFILLSFAIYLLFAGHNSPGGGFVGGLTTSAAFLLMYISFGQSTIDKILSINFINLVPIGLMIALLTGLGSLLFNKPFLTQTFGHVNLPLFGEFELATAMLFDLGVFLTTSAAFLLMYISFGQSTIDKILSINFINLVPIGLMIALLTGLGSLLFNKPFLTQTFGHVNLPLFGEFELATAMLFDLGVFLT